MVNIGKSFSGPLEVTCGVPQGSLLGPLLFLYYINDLEISVDSDCKLLLYTNDSAILFSHKDPNVVAQKSWLHFRFLQQVACGQQGPRSHVGQYKSSQSGYLSDDVGSNFFAYAILTRYFTRYFTILVPHTFMITLSGWQKSIGITQEAALSISGFRM